MANLAETRRARLRRLFPRGPITQTSWEVDDSFFAELFSDDNEEERSSLADRIEHTGHALKAKDLCRLLNLSEVTVFKFAKAGRIPSFRIGTSVRFDPHTIADWLRKQ